MHKRLVSGLLAGAAAMLVPAIAFAAGGDPITEAGQNGLDIAIGIGPIATALGVAGACAGGMIRSTGVLALGSTVAVCGGAWTGAPQLVETVVGAAAGFTMSDLTTSPASIHALSIIGWLVG